MTKHRLKGSFKSFRNHLDPEKEENQKWMKTQVERKVKEILSLARGIGTSQKDEISRKRSELIHLIQDVHRQYESLYSRYEDLKWNVKKNVDHNHEDSSSLSPSSSDSESYFSPDESVKSSSPNATNDDDNNAETSTGAEKSVVSRLKVENETLRVQNQQLEEKISNLISQNDELLLEVDDLKAQRCELEEKLSRETNERSSQSKGLIEEIDSLQRELLSVNGRKAKLELELEMKPTGSPVQFKNLIRESMSPRSPAQFNLIRESMSPRSPLQFKNLTRESMSPMGGSIKKAEPEELVAKPSQESCVSEVEYPHMQRKISNLQSSLSERETELSTLRKKCVGLIETLRKKVQEDEKVLKEVCNKRDRLQAELDAEKQQSTQLKNMNLELTDKIADQQKTMLELGEAVDKLKTENEKSQFRVSDPKLKYHTLERKMEEMAENIRNEFEAKCRILSRRVKVAEQLQTESKEWCLRTKEMSDEKSHQLKEWMEKKEAWLVNIKGMSMTANDLLVSLDRVTLRYEERTANFLNRISKASCELMFAQDWVKRKNTELLHVKEELDRVVMQLDEKEEEILMCRNKLWKSENKVRKLEKMRKRNVDGMVVLQEEKREAIRQLCVWIDYHRSRSDYYKRRLSECSGRKKATRT